MSPSRSAKTIPTFAKVCARSARNIREYWRKLEDNDDYAEEFIQELTGCRLSGGPDPGGIWRVRSAAARRLRDPRGDQRPWLPGQCRSCADVQRACCCDTAIRSRRISISAAGKIRYQAFGVTEPTTGSDTLKLKTRAEKKGDRYIINGQKIGTPRAHKSDLMIALVRTTPVDQVKKRTDGLSVLLVDVKEALGRVCRCSASTP